MMLPIWFCPGMSRAVSTATTPGEAAAAAVSILRILPCATGEGTATAWSVPWGAAMSRT